MPASRASAAIGGHPFHRSRGPPPPGKQGEASIEVKARAPLPIDERQGFEEMESRHYAFLPTPAVGQCYCVKASTEKELSF